MSPDADGVREPRERDHRDGVRSTLPLAIAVAGFGVSFGVLARAAGMGSAAPIVMSATTFAGSAQFAATSVLSTRWKRRHGGRRRGAAERALRTDRGQRGTVAHTARGGRGSSTPNSWSTNRGRSRPRATDGSTRASW